jgi:hypothetical protein
LHGRYASYWNLAHAQAEFFEFTGAIDDEQDRVKLEALGGIP